MTTAFLVWIGGFALMLVWLAVLAARARADAERVVSRATVVAAAALTAALGVGSAYVWGVVPAREGMARIAASGASRSVDANTGESASASASESADTGQSRAEPARARLFLRHVQLLLAPDPVPANGQGATSPNLATAGAHSALVGHSPEAGLRLPRSYGLQEAKQGWDLMRVRAAGPQGLRVEAVSHPEDTGTRLLLAAQRRDIDTAPSPESMAASARTVAGRGGRQCRSAAGNPADIDGAAGSANQADLDGPGAIYAVLCAGGVPRAALVFERDLAAQEEGRAGVAVRVTPFIWRGNGWRPHHVQIASGSLMQIGTMADALPGVTLWEVPAPAGRAELFFPPQDLLAGCPEWLAGRTQDGFFSNPPPIDAPAPTEDADDPICVLPFTPPFGLEVRRLLPDLPAIGARSLWAAGLMTTPALLLLLFLCAQPRGELTRRRFRRLMALGWLAALLAALAVWRLLWAHRIDMLRDYEPVGARILQNQVLLVFVGAALAATCVLAWLSEPRGPRRHRAELRALVPASLAWLVWLAVAGYALGGDLGEVGAVFAGSVPGSRVLGQALTSLALGTAMAWLVPLRQAALPRARRVLGRLHALVATRLRPGSASAEERAATADADTSSADTDAWLLATSSLAALAVVAILARFLAPAAVALKLGLAWVFVLVAYASLRAASTPAGMVSGRLAISSGLGAVAAAALASFDTGVTVAIAGPGFIAALVVASHDARFGDIALRRMDSYRRHHAPLVAAHAALLGLMAMIIIVWAARGLVATAGGEPDAMLARSLTLGAVHLVLILALMFLATAALTYVRAGIRAAAPWLAVSAALAIIWLARNPLMDQVIGSSSQAASRIAIVLDPGYALLRSETKFLAGITAWRETILPAGAPLLGAGQLWAGQGYFGAQLIDPGVLLSVENDYFPVLLVREAGVRGLLATMLLSLTMVAGLWILAGTRFRHGSASQRSRALAAALLGLVCMYQPLASLGALPLTGISWPGLGLDSPSDLWLLFALLSWMLVWSVAADASAPASTASAAGAGNEAARLDELDRELRRSRLFRRMRMAVAATASVAVVAGLLLLSRAATFALRRPNPVDPAGRAVRPFDGLQHAVDYAYRLQCPWPQKAVPADAANAADSLVPSDLLGDPEVGGTSRFHADLRAAWQASRPQAVAAVSRFVAGQGCAVRGPASPWSAQPSPEDPAECRLTFKAGWPEVELAVRRGQEPESQPIPADAETAPQAAPADAEAAPSATPDAAASAEPAPSTPVHTARCGVEVRSDVVRALRFPARRPYRNARIRLVSRAMGDAARDVGEMVSGHLIVRLRPDAGPVDVAQARAGLYAGNQIRISRELEIVINGGRAVLRRTAPPAPKPDALAPTPPKPDDNWLFMREPPARQVQVLEADEGAWRLVPPEVTEVPLERMALLVVGGPDARSLWLFRPPTEWPGEPAAVHPLVADDISTVVGERRRHYLLGGLLPEIGWVNPYHSRMSLGLDGWVHVAMAEYEASAATRPAPATPTATPMTRPMTWPITWPITWLDDGGETPYCATMATGADSPDSADTALTRVCTENPIDGVLECRVSLQPELAIRLRHLTELIALDPARFGEPRSAAPTHAAYALLRGDTGEILAQGEHVPGRASSVYAPATPEIEQYLIRLREDRDPETGRKLPPYARGEASAEKTDWSRPIAVGSTLKPLLGRALELADPMLASSLVLTAAPTAAGLCRPGVHALLGHCPPTESLWNHSGSTGINQFLSASLNWYQAAMGILGTAVPSGTVGLGTDQTAVDFSQILSRNLGNYTLQNALWTGSGKGRQVIGANHTVHLGNLRDTPMWQHFEALLGRSLCTAGNKAACVRQSARKDLCAARALPIRAPTRDLRHLVALGPNSFDLYPELADPARRQGVVVNVREYFQFLRGSGLHPVGSLLQLTDAFSRVIYDRRDPDTQASSRNPGFRVAASWFPTAAAGDVPAWDCTSVAQEQSVRGGLCNALASGTASRALGSLLGDERFVLYGAKTGTIDSLADVAENQSACERFRDSHTIPDRPARKAEQPYWLPCSGERAPSEVNDSLLMISFAVRTPEGLVPLTLGLRFQRSGSGLATLVARHYLELIHDYFAPSAPAPAGPAPAPGQ